MKVKIEISLNKNILDPQGDAIKQALQQMNFENVVSVRQGKLIELDLNVGNQKEAYKLAEMMAKDLLSNPVMETYSISIK